MTRPFGRVDLGVDPFGRASVIACAVVLLAAFLAACSTGTVVLLPEKDAHQTAVVVKQRDRELVLDQPYAAATQTPFGPRAYTSTPQEVQAVFAAALAAQPMRPTQFTLYFVEGKDELTDASKQMVESVFSEISKHPVPDLLVIGHTDAVGNDQDNDVLSLQRADTIRAALIERGVAPQNVVAIGRGKRELIVPTADGVSEPRNRRVDIIVR
jgi:outer membrane protein OmpA-like peptidoglycan-associated protein